MKTKLAWAIVDKKEPRILLEDIYQDKIGILIAKNEKFIRVEIKEVVKKK